MATRDDEPTLGRQLFKEFFNIARNNVQHLDPFGQSLGIFGKQQQSILRVGESGKEIPASIFLETAPFDPRDL